MIATWKELDFNEQPSLPLGVPSEDHSMHMAVGLELAGIGEGVNNDLRTHKLCLNTLNTEHIAKLLMNKRSYNFVQSFSKL